MKTEYDVAILGAGVAGSAAAYALRGWKVLLLESESFVGGRTYSECFEDGLWANYGAGYFSSDKRTIIELGDAVGVEYVGFDDSALTGDFMPSTLTLDDIVEIRQVKRRIAREQGRRRDPASPDLDTVSFAEWLGPVRPNVRAYWDLWCSTMSAPMDKISLYGMLLMTGANRTTAFADEAVDYDPRGNLVVKGGNGIIAQRLVEASGADMLLQHTVTKVEMNAGGGYDIVARSNRGAAAFSASAVVSALPAPVVQDVFPFLPDWKQKALDRIVYGRIIGMPVVVGPKEGSYARYVTADGCRAGAQYCETDFLLRSPTDLDREGAYFVCQVYDRAARAIWEDDDDSIRAGVFAAFSQKFPDLAARVRMIGVHRWHHGLPQYSLGRMAATPDLIRQVDGVSFCGDYTDVTHTDGAARSGLRAASEVRKHLAAERT